MALIVSALSLVSLEQSQAQLFINIYPSQDNPTNQTVWIFSGTSTTAIGSSIRTSTGSNNFGFGDTVQLVGNIYDANSPSNVNFSLSSLFASSNTKDIKSVAARIPSGGKTNITFAASATNTPTITIGSRTISHLFMDDNSSEDDIGIRVSGSSSFSFAIFQSSA